MGSPNATVIAARAGTIVSIGTDKRPGPISGKCNDDINCIVIDHHDGFYTEYREFDLSSNPKVLGVPFKIGDLIDGAEPLGTVPGPGGSALHFQVSTFDASSGLLNSKLVNPALATVTVGGRLFKDYKLDMNSGHPIDTAIYGQTNPRLPTSDLTSPAFDFDVVIGDVGLGKDLPIFVDPPIALGYDFRINSGPLFTSVILPDVGDGLFDLYLLDQAVSECVFNAPVRSGVQFHFPGGGVGGFCIRGIEVSALLDPRDPTAFVTGVTFADVGPVDFTQTPIRGDIPEPSTAAMLIFPIVGLAARRKNTHGKVK